MDRGKEHITPRMEAHVSSAACPACERTPPGVPCRLCGHVRWPDGGPPPAAGDEATYVVPRKRLEGLPTRAAAAPPVAPLPPTPTRPPLRNHPAVLVAGAVLFSGLGFALAWCLERVLRH